MKLRHTSTQLACLLALLPACAAYSTEIEDPRRSGANASNPVVADGRDVVVDNISVETTGDGQQGLQALSNGSITVSDSVILTHGAGRAYAVGVEGGGRIDITHSAIRTEGGYSHALNAFGEGSTIRARDTSIVVTGDTSSVVDIEGGAVELERVTATTRGTGTAILQSDGTLVARDTDLVAEQGDALRTNGGQVSYTGGSIRAAARGVSIWISGRPLDAVFRNTDIHAGQMGVWITGNGAKVDLDALRITVSGIGSPGSSNGLVIDGASTLTVTDSSIDTFGVLGLGVTVGNGARVSMIGSRISTHGDRGLGLWTADGLMTLSTGAITTYGPNAYGMLVDGLNMYDPKLSVAKTKVATHGRAAHGLASMGAVPHLSSVDLHTYGAGANGIWLYSTDPDGHGGVIADMGSRIESEDGAAIRVSGGSQNISLSDTTVVARSNGAQGVMLNVEPLHEPTFLEIVADPTASRDDPVGVGRVDVIAERSRLEGDVVVTSGATRLALHDHSSLIGALRNSDGHAVDTLSIDESSTWRVRADSAVQHLDTAGTVSFASPDARFNVVDVTGNLTGAGTFEMRTDVAAGQGDLLRIGGTVQGTHRVLVANSGREPSAPNGALRLIQSEGGPGSFTLANRGQVVDVGTYRYELKADDSLGGRPGDWSLVNITASPVAPLGRIRLSTTANAAINTSAAGATQTIWHAENATLIRRMGDLRDNSAGDNVWVRGFGERQNVDNRGARAYHQNIKGIQTGLDKRIPVGAGQWYMGGFAGVSHTDRRFGGEGNGRTTSYHGGAYATYLDKSGWYLDGVVKVNRFSSRFDVTATDGRSVRAKTQTGAVGASLEAGRRVHIGGNWFVEPQAQVTVVRTGGDAYRASNLLQVDAAGGNSIQLRAGSLLGRRIELQGENFIQPYARVGWLQEIDGKSVVHTNGVARRTDISGGGVELGAGVTAALASRHKLYADYRYSAGGRVGTPSAFSLGYRYVW
ncbi:autotransporter outer membrane beta-barrel domain-containing protein [Achromobacter sp. DH1f]|uniref:autotransporter outer membrane beta-barrel domain-containing protein n=1 Tax=Achromobacter sp. DH1f TaxID=1397275 RepID=UPI0012FF44F7|nr:autotransporter outer membrane beta-barrel domain-containing protein [Achromobacter sp. DH1f]